ncbi:oocyte zinc finger protein XlCOF6-like [Manduca sexta]|uniref:oocyte zinc finger protein XlCOF6-like n=1 Tax=Manduca sexta TaxID=7130 RepID=UPI001182BD29|nr:oocyte zinc finger protein XlCOF6-like [Manduca sexta]
MEYQRTIITNYGECRCCLTKGNHRDLTKEYYYNGIREVFIDIFMECFNLYLSTNENLTMLICSSCVSRLRDASSFRMMVLRTERQLMDALTSHDHNYTVFINVPTVEPVVVNNDIKEEQQVEVKTEDDNVELNYNFSYQIETDEENTEEGDGEVEGEGDLRRRFAGALRPLPTRATLRGHCPMFVKHLDALRGKSITAKSIEKLILGSEKRSKPHKNISHIREKMAHTINACTIFECSTATAFKTKTKAGFPCFYCRDIFDNMEILREHQKKHPKSLLFKLLSKYTADTLVVYADITNLACSICCKEISSINDLKSHLISVHNKKMYTDFEDRVIPFKLTGHTDFECQICGFNFETFGSIEKHMNIHYRNNICDQCGAGFVTMHRLKIHYTTVHKEGSYPCKICKKIYSSYNKYKIHYDVVHKLVKKNKCPKCPESFVDYFTRQRHLVEKHGVTPILYKCKVCDRAFSRRFTLSGHMKRCHLEEKDIQCPQCAYMCYTKSELRAHMLKHGAERCHQCAVCKKSYARQKTLKEHMRIHNNDRRFACADCGQAFVQRCSLKGHIKTHHSK